MFDYPLSWSTSSGSQQYPEISNIKYPKPGTPNPRIQLRVMADIVVKGKTATSTRDMRLLDLELPRFPDDPEGETPIVYAINWTPDSKGICVRVTNRNQNHELLVYYDVSSTDPNRPKIIRETKRAWFEKSPSLLFLNNTNNKLEYVDIIEVDGHFHLAKFDLLESKPKQILTRGQFEVTDILGLTAGGVLVYCATDSLGTQRLLYSVDTRSGNSSSSYRLTAEDGYYSYKISPSSKWLSLSYRGPSIPQEYAVELQETSDRQLKAVRGKQLRPKEALSSRLQKFTLPTVQLLQLPVTDESTNQTIMLNAKLHLPPGFSPNYTHLYPLLVKVYGGPNSQQVDQVWSVGFETFLASNWHQASLPPYYQSIRRNQTFTLAKRLPIDYNQFDGNSTRRRVSQPPFIVLTIDPRGTGYRGLNFSFIVNERLGHYESHDVTRAVERFIQQHSFIDPDKVGIWGWSYGGYLSAKVIETDQQLSTNGRLPVFKAAVSVAPVTDWMLYDSVYTERYMKQPNNDVTRKAYKSSAVSNVDALKSIRYLLIHGTADDNVHKEQSMRLERMLRESESTDGSAFRIHFVSDDNHSMALTSNARNFVFRMVWKWFVNAWQEIDELRKEIALK